MKKEGCPFVAIIFVSYNKWLPLSFGLTSFPTFTISKSITINKSKWGILDLNIQCRYFNRKYGIFELDTPNFGMLGPRCSICDLKTAIFEVSSKIGHLSPKKPPFEI